MLIDSHCHLNFPDLVARLPEVLANMHSNDIRQALAIRPAAILQAWAPEVTLARILYSYLVPEQNVLPRFRMSRLGSSQRKRW